MSYFKGRICPTLRGGYVLLKVEDTSYFKGRIRLTLRDSLTLRGG